MAFNKKLILSFILLILTACASSTKNIKKNQKLESNQGIVVTKINSNWTGYNNPLATDLEFLFTHEESNKKSSKFVLSKENDLKVVALAAGNYQWLRIRFGNYYMDLEGGFTIEPGQITYIGDIYSHLDLNLFSMSGTSRVTNESEQIMNDLKDNYPMLLERHIFTTNLSTLKQM